MPVLTIIPVAALMGNADNLVTGKTLAGSALHGGS